MEQIDLDCPVIVGAGLAGLTTAIELSPTPCLVVTAGALGMHTSTDWAQGGVAAAVGEDDSPKIHAQDTLAAGAGLCDPDAVRRITAQGPAAIEWLAGIGTQFDRRADGRLKRGLEGAHSRRRIVHAMGDKTGAELLRAVIAKAKSTPSITVWAHCRATEIVVEEGRLIGLRLQTSAGPLELRTGAVILASGGIGGLFSHTTNPLSSRGQGLALAYRAGATLRDMEMVQFHPTALDVGIDPMPLVSEAVRGEGAILVNEAGRLVLENPLAARDVVARAEWRMLQAGHKVFLDARERPGQQFHRLFPQITEKAAAAGLDPSKDFIPVRPAAHYHMGGVLVDHHGESTLPGLYAVGEVASTGLHGANRLASNSLLEAVVCGRWTGSALRGQFAHRFGCRLPAPPALNPLAAEPANPELAHIRATITAGAGVLRNKVALESTLAKLRPYLATDAGLVAHLLATAALERQESRGAHTRLDYPAADDEITHTLLRLPGQARQPLKQTALLMKDSLR
ncbi:MAG: L-aspartate oxidase [Propionibacteriaceae bacterium]|jgi:L-aspartate oxidase|nr:L-aspartate oxidase [Propionibacteriaceae bacterium]